MCLDVCLRSLHFTPLPGEGLYFLLGSPRRSKIHCFVLCDRASVATLVMWERLVSHLSSSGTMLSGLLPLAASLAYSSAFSFPVTPWWAGTHRTVISLSLDITRLQPSMAAMPKLCPGLMASVLILSTAKVESMKIVYCWPLSCLWSITSIACAMA